MENHKRVILVIGIAQSGTSVLTKGLATMRVSMGDICSSPNPFEKQDLCEDPEFHALNLEMLHFFGAHLRGILPVTQQEVDLLYKAGFLKKASQLLQKKMVQDVWINPPPLVIKDPRFSLLLPFWKKVFQHARIHPSFVIALRNPWSVAASQKQHREKFFWMWISYMLSCLSQLKKLEGDAEDYPRIIVDYDELIQNSAHQMKRVAHALGLALNQKNLASYCRDYVNPLARHFNENIEIVESDDFCKEFALEMYTQLLRVARDEIDLEQLKESQTKWEKQFLEMHSLLVLAEKNNFTIEELKTTLQKLDHSIHQSQKVINQKSYEIASYCQSIHQRELEIASLLEAQGERSSELFKLQQALARRHLLIAS